MERVPRRTYEFGSYRLNVDERLLCRGSDVIRLTPKAFDALVFLVRRSGHLVTKDELIQALWPDACVEENNLAQHISFLRRTLTDGLPGTAYIETVPRTGYRFIAPVRETNGEPDASMPAPPPLVQSAEVEVGASSGPDRALARRPAPVTGFRLRPRLAMPAILVTATLTAVLSVRSIPQSATVLPSVAVLPFDIDSPNGRASGVTLSFAADLIDRLTRFRQGQVLPIGSVYRFFDTSVAPLAAAKELGTSSVLYGRVHAIDDEPAQVTVQLVRVVDSHVLWSGTMSVPNGALDRVEDQIAGPTGLALGWSEVNARRAQPQLGGSFEARQAYALGRYLWSTRSPEGLYRSISLLERAVALEPANAEFHAALADADAFDLGKWQEGEREARTALELHHGLGAPHATLGFIRLFWLRQIKAAEEEFRTASRLEPRYATAHEWYGLSLVSHGDTNGASAEIQEARTLDPYSLPILGDQCQIAYLSQDFDRALAACNEAIRLDPTFTPAHVTRLAILEQTAKNASALDEYSRICAISRRPPCGLLAGSGLLPQGHAEWDLPTFWRTEIRLLERDPPALVPDLRIAQDYAHLGEKEAALASLDRVAASSVFDALFVWEDPAFHFLRSEPKFVAIVIRILSPRDTSPIPSLPSR